MKTVIALFALAAAAGTAAAIDVSAQPLTSQAGYGERATPIFSAIPSPYVAFPAGTGVLGFDDYNSTLPGGTYETLTTLRFVGGVTAVGGRLDFNFRQNDGTLFSSFFVNFPSAGNFIWSIGTDANPIGTLIPADGILEIVADANTTGQWFLSTGVPTLGTEDRAIGSVTTHSHRFELSIPAPGAAALMGLAGLVAGRRRR